MYAMCTTDVCLAWRGPSQPCSERWERATATWCGRASIGRGCASIARWRSGTRGGHGAVRYRVTEYDPALGRVVFAFEPKGALGGFDGRHLFEALPCPGGTLLRHSVEAISDLTTAMRWLVMIRPIHDAAIEDALDRVELQLTGGIRQQTEWSPYVRWLRRRRGLSPRKEVGSAISA